MKKPFYKQVWFWVAVVIIGGIIGLFTEDKTPEEPAVAKPQKKQAKQTEPGKEEITAPKYEIVDDRLDESGMWYLTLTTEARGEEELKKIIESTSDLAKERDSKASAIFVDFQLPDKSTLFAKGKFALNNTGLAQTGLSKVGDIEFEFIGTTEPDVSADKTKAGNEVEETAVDWEASLAKIIKEDSSPTEKADATELLARDYQPSDEELKEFEKYIVKEFSTGKYLQDPENAEYMLSNLFKSVVVERSYDDSENEPIDKFAFDFYQNTKYVYRGADAPDSDDVKENESQMKEALTSLK